MHTRQLGTIEVPVIGIGCNQIGVTVDRVGTAQIVRAALDTGVTLFDTADEYGNGASEEFLARALGPHRAEVVIATKIGCVMPDEPGSGGASPCWIRTAVEGSLRRLNTDYVDLLQMHYPDPAVPIEETLGVLTELVAAGKAREIGCSNYSPAQVTEASEVACERDMHGFVSLQAHLNLLRQRALDDLVPAAATAGMSILPYWPLASGLLTGKYARGRPPGAESRMAKYPDAADAMLTARNFTRIEALTDLATAHGLSLAALAFGWLLANQGIGSVIAGVTRAEQVRANAEHGSRAALDSDLVASATALGCERPGGVMPDVSSAS